LELHSYQNPSAIRNQYAELGVETYYEKFGSQYRNPHEYQLITALHKYFKQLKSAPCSIDICNKSQGMEKYLDLCCGSGEMTLGLCQYLMKYCQWQEWYKHIQVTANDPYTYQAYINRILSKKEGTNTRESDLVLQSIVKPNVFKYTFVDIVEGCFKDYHCDMILCSYALHLCTEKSLLQTLCWNLNLISSYLLIVTPHKRPEILSCWGWKLLYESVIDRIRFRLYQSQSSIQLFKDAEMVSKNEANSSEQKNPL